MYAKFVVALSGALAVATSVTIDGDLSLNDVFAIASAGIAALAVYIVPNKPQEG